MSRDRGSALLLVPAAMLVVLMFAALAVDAARLHLERRALADTAGTAANDVAGLVLDPVAWRELGEPVADRARLAGACERVRSVAPDGADLTCALGDGVVLVRVESTVEHLLSGAVPGLERTTTLAWEAEAELRSP